MEFHILSQEKLQRLACGRIAEVITGINGTCFDDIQVAASIGLIRFRDLIGAEKMLNFRHQ